MAIQQIIDNQDDLHTTAIPSTRRVEGRQTEDQRRELTIELLEAHRLGLRGDELLAYLDSKKENWGPKLVQ